jgi:hypothetical protein
MAAWLKKLSSTRQSSGQDQVAPSPSYDERKAPDGAVSSYGTDDKDRSNVEPEADKILNPGELSFEETTSGGLGRHLGLFSTTFLMYVP